MALRDKEEIRNWVIYKITSPTNRVYVGITSNFTRRIECYRNHYREAKQPLLFRSLNKYGFESHKVDKIEEFKSDKGFAFGKEIFWIRTYMSNSSKWPEQRGMNLTDGGEGTIGQKHTPSQNAALRKRMANFKQTDESKKRISESKKGVKRYNMIGRKMNLSDEERKARSERAKNQKNRVGRKHTEESKKKMSLSQQGRDYSYLVGRKMPEHVGKLLSERNKGNKYNLGKKASEETKRKISVATKGKMSMEKRVNLSNRMKGVKNFLGKTHTEEFKKKLSIRFKGVTVPKEQAEKIKSIITEKYGKPILQYSLSGLLIKEHLSKRQCSLDVGISRSSLKSYLNGGVNKSTFIFKYK